jgi:DNA polymerase III delta subunit
MPVSETVVSQPVGEELAPAEQLFRKLRSQGSRIDRDVFDELLEASGGDLLELENLLQ